MPAVTLLNCRAQFCSSGLATSRSHFTDQTALPRGPMTPSPKSRLVQWAVLCLAVMVVMLLPATMRAQDSETVLYSFCTLAGCADGRSPEGTLVFDAHGNLYGSTGFGGPGNAGVVFELSPPAGGSGPWTETVLHSFCSLAQCQDGQQPSAGVILDAQGNLYRYYT
jgi:uncharacterized repeat protein (TIGR03803 family)